MQIAILLFSVIIFFSLRLYDVSPQQIFTFSDDFIAWVALSQIEQRSRAIGLLGNDPIAPPLVLICSSSFGPPG